MDGRSAAPRASLSTLDGIALLVGVVVGIGIFKTPALVAANTAGEWGFLALWLLGGAITLVGAFVYAELGSAHPSTGGEYHYLARGLGQPLGLLFAWARAGVIQPGAIAAVAFVFGEYATQLVPLGPGGAALWAALAIGLFTGLNLAGAAPSTRVQLAIVGLAVAALLAVALAGLAVPAAAPPAQPAAAGATGLAMVFILLTYGGWNEAAYLSAELRDPRRNMARVLILGTLAVVALYVLFNLALLRVLGLDGLRASQAVGADLMRGTFGEAGAVVLSLIVCCAALSTLNATIFTGARIYHAVGQDLDVPAMRWLGAWRAGREAPAGGLLAQSAIALALVGFGAVAHDGFTAMVEYTAPVFWLFLLLVGIAALRLRRGRAAFRAPLHPLMPVLFCATCAYLLYASLAYTGWGALFGVAVLAAGVPLVALALRRRQTRPFPAE